MGPGNEARIDGMNICLIQAGSLVGTDSAR